MGIIMQIDAQKAVETLLVNIPAAGAVIVTMILFLKRDRERDAFLRDLHMESEESRKASRQVIQENTLMAGRHLEIAKNVSELLHEVSQTLRGCQIQREMLEQKMNHHKE